MADYQIDSEDFLTIYLDHQDLEATIEGKVSIGIEIVLEPPGSISAGTVLDEALSARVLTAVKFASETISALQLVYLDSHDTCAIADRANDDTGMVFGVALNAGNQGDPIRIRIFGILEDPFFNFGLNDPIFLGDAGAMTSTAPLTGVLTSIGFGIGPGAISINLQRPINL